MPIEQWMRGNEQSRQRQAETDLDKEAEEVGIPPEVLEVIRTSIDVEQWMKRTRAGRYLVQRCAQQIQNSKDIIFDATDLNTPEVRQAHHDARVANTIMQWLNEALDVGRQAAEGVEIDTYEV